MLADRAAGCRYRRSRNAGAVPVGCRLRAFFQLALASEFAGVPAAPLVELRGSTLRRATVLLALGGASRGLLGLSVRASSGRLDRRGSKFLFFLRLIDRKAERAPDLLEGIV